MAEFNWAATHEARCRDYCGPIAAAILAGLEGTGEVSLHHTPPYPPITASVRFPELDLRVSFEHAIWTVEDAVRQLPAVRYRIARALEYMEAEDDGHDRNVLAAVAADLRDVGVNVRHVRSDDA
jgi:hypothetical protein